MFKLDERYLCAYLCNKNLIDKFNILMNFYNEVAAISLKTQNSQLMQIRIKWFMDAIVNLYNDLKSGFPIIDDLSIIIDEYIIDKEDLITILHSRTLDKEYIPFNNKKEYIKYCQNTCGILWKLVMKIYGGNEKEQKLAYLCGTIYAILGNIRNITFDSKKLIYKLVFDKKIIIKGDNCIENEMQHNILDLLTIIKKYFSVIKATKINKRCRKLLLLNIFNENYYYQIKQNNGKYKNINFYNIRFKYRLKFIFKYIFNF